MKVQIAVPTFKCNEHFASLITLRIHMATFHTEEKKYYCYICYEVFDFRKDWKLHIDIEHLGIN